MSVRPLLWLGAERGYLSDWVTQRWVASTGRRVDVARDSWLDAPVGGTSGIGRDFFLRFAEEQGLEVRRNAVAGLIVDFDQLRSDDFDPTAVHPAVAAFYRETSAFDMDAWSEWCRPFRPFGWLLAFLFSRRLQQLNVPISALDTSRGITSEVLQLVEPHTGIVRCTAWVRELVGSRNVLYAGSYSVCRVPGHPGPCIRVAFPLPNGNALVIMKPQAHDDGSFTVSSSGMRFGDPGFYFTVQTRKGVVARYLRSLRESIHVFAGDDVDVRADHVLTLWGARFLRLHYRLRRRPAEVADSP
jgi:hypothetical protein